MSRHDTHLMDGVPVPACCDPAPDRSGRACDLPRGHRDDHWTRDGNTLRWPQAADGVARIAAERERQKAREGYSDAHDDTHGDFQMMRSAVAYALHAGGFTNASDHWPFGLCEWKPSVGDPIRDLTKAGALIAAEIDRLQRLLGSGTQAANRHSVTTHRSAAQ